MNTPRKNALAKLRARLKVIPTAIGRAHAADNAGLCALLYAEKALLLEQLHGASGTGEILAHAQKDAAVALEKAGIKRHALDFYRKAFLTRGRVIKHLASREGMIREQAIEIARLKGILASAPDPATRDQLEETLRSQGLLLPGETLRYEADVEELKTLIAHGEQRKRNSEQESGFSRAHLALVKSDLAKLESKIKRLEADLAAG